MKKLILGMLALAGSAFAVAAVAGSITQPPPTPLPEPGTLGLLAVGIAGVAIARLRSRK